MPIWRSKQPKCGQWATVGSSVAVPLPSLSISHSFLLQISTVWGEGLREYTDTEKLVGNVLGSNLIMSIQTLRVFEDKGEKSRTSARRGGGVQE